MTRRGLAIVDDPEVLDLPPLEDLDDFAEMFSVARLKSSAINGAVGLGGIIGSQLLAGLSKKLPLPAAIAKYGSPMISVAGGIVVSGLLSARYPKYADILGAVLVGNGFFNLLGKDGLDILSKVPGLEDVEPIQFPQLAADDEEDEELLEQAEEDEEEEVAGYLADAEDEEDEMFEDVEPVTEPMFV